MMNDKVGGVYYTTENYGVFKTLLGNRDVTEARVAKIKESIQNRGYIWSSIVVNEKYEVIDGQGRLEALKQLGLPVDYGIVNGLTVEDCISMNINMGNWNTADYIKSYAAQGNDNYKRLQELVTRYNLPHSIVIAAAKGNAVFGYSINAIKKGNVILNQEDYNAAIPKLEYIEKARKYTTKQNTLLAIMFCGWVGGVNQDRLLEICKNNVREVEKMGKVEDIIGVIEDLYNYHRIERLRIPFKAQYKKYCRESNANYRSRWEKETGRRG